MIRFFIAIFLTASALQAQTPTSPTIKMGGWASTIYGLVQFDQIYDSTQSFGELAANSPIARPDTPAGQSSSYMMSIRNSQLGIRVLAPDVWVFKPSMVFEFDLRGATPNTSENATFTNPGFRVRHLFARLETRYFDITLGQFWALFGWQAAYFPISVQWQGLPGQLFFRTPQLRVSEEWKLGDFTLESAVAVVRPPQKAGSMPDFQIGLKLNLDTWKATNMIQGAIREQPLSVAVSGTIRRFKTATDSSIGAGIAVNTFIPFWNCISAVGEYVYGNGIGDLYTGLGGPTAPGFDPGEAMIDGNGRLQLANWQSYRLGLQWFPMFAKNQFWVSTNFHHMESGNWANYTENFADGNLFYEFFQGFRLGLEYAYFWNPSNHRVQLAALYQF